jgi:hypothetical protein
MTKDEIREFVKTIICDGEFGSMTGIDVAVNKIVDEWEEDVQIRSDEAFTRGQSSMLPF